MSALGATSWAVHVCGRPLEANQVMAAALVTSFTGGLLGANTPRSLSATVSCTVASRDPSVDVSTLIWPLQDPGTSNATHSCFGTNRSSASVA